MNAIIKIDNFILKYLLTLAGAGAGFLAGSGFLLAASFAGVGGGLVSSSGQDKT